MKGERGRLAAVAKGFDSGEGFNGVVVRYAADMVARHIQGPKVLEMGCANGHSTERFLREPWQLWVVEGAEKYAEQARELFIRYGSPPERVLCMLFEEFAPSDPFDDIVMSYILEHVEDPEALLARVVTWLKPGGLLHVCVPNGYSLHRQLGVAMEMADDTTRLSLADRRIGHRRVFDPASIGDLLFHRGFGLSLEDEGAIMLKPFPNSIMDRVAMDPAIAAGLAQLAENHAREASDLYVCCQRKAES